MQIITLNTWGGRAGKENLLSFFEQYRETTDVFCLQEMWRAPYDALEGVDQTDVVTNILQEVTKVLENDFDVYFRPHHKEDYGLAMYVKKSIPVLEEGERFVHKYKGYINLENAGLHSRNVQFLKIGEGEQMITVMNFHGLWNGMGKNDSEDRIIQSENIIQFLGEQQGKIILAGDFNLLPNTKSLQMLEEFGLRNLIKEYKVTSTRTSYYTKPEKFADYILVSSDVAVRDFRVLPEEVSDHSALLIDFEE